MAEDLKTQEGLEGVGGQEVKETESASSIVATEDKASVEPAPAPETPSVEVDSSPSNSSTSSESVAPQAKFDPNDGGSWEALSKKVGEATCT